MRSVITARRLRIAGIVTLLLATWAVATGSTAAGAGEHPAAVTVAGDPSIGPLFPHGLTAAHTCTASVIGGARDLLLTAAHCISGTGSGIEFAPAYDGTAAVPAAYGVWNVDQVWVAPGWLAGQDPEDDYAVLRVADQNLQGKRTSVEEVTGGNQPGFSESAGTTVTVIAYPAGSGDAPISCTSRTFAQGVYPGFHCGGYANGTSGAPWLAAAGKPGRRTLVGLIGGLHQGGCTDDTSYSSPLGPNAYMLMIRAVLSLSGDTVPVAHSDGC